MEQVDSELSLKNKPVIQDKEMLNNLLRVIKKWIIRNYIDFLFNKYDIIAILFGIGEISPKMFW
jgi:hypothetical protein